MGQFWAWWMGKQRWSEHIPFPQRPHKAWAQLTIIQAGKGKWFCERWACVKVGWGVCIKEWRLEESVWLWPAELGRELSKSQWKHGYHAPCLLVKIYISNRLKCPLFWKPSNILQSWRITPSLALSSSGLAFSSYALYDGWMHLCILYVSNSSEDLDRICSFINCSQPWKFDM